MKLPLARPLTRLTLACLAALFLLTPCLAQEQEERLQQAAARLEKILLKNIVPFWLPRSLDKQNGGYLINFNTEGEPNGKESKGIVTQARMVWFWSRLARSGYAESLYSREQLLEAAGHGYRFLRDKMWDAQHGGFYWEVDAAGDQKLRAGKHLYGQSFALYALSEYYLAAGRQNALDFAADLFYLLETKAHDKTYGGYREFFNADWSEPSKGEAPYVGRVQGFKLMNTHLHLLEAMTTFYEASRLPLARERLLELIAIESNAVVRKDLSACTDVYERDWTPRLEADFARVSYGHDLENIWLLMDANKAAALSNYPFLDLYKNLFLYSLKYGYDPDEGGFFAGGGFNEPADERNKIWWVQAEALVSALRMYEWTGEKKYLGVFLRTLDFIEQRQVDWEHGEWHGTVSPLGAGFGDKAHIWKAAYHNGRAMIECLDALKRLQNRPPGVSRP